jgi:uncharacterized protein (DUF4415 family)
MKPKPNPELVDAENPEWTEDDFRRSVRFSQLPREVQKKLATGKHQIVEETEEIVTVPLAANVVAGFRAGGAGWEARINEVLAEWLSRHPPEDQAS